MNINADPFLLTPEDYTTKLAGRSQKERAGYKHIRIVNNGDILFNRVHSIKVIVQHLEFDVQTGAEKPVYREEDGILTFFTNPNTMEREAYVYDCEYNRHWLSNHLDKGLIIPENEEIYNDIKLLEDKVYKVEPSEMEMLKRRLDKDNKRLAQLEKEEEERLKAEKKAIDKAQAQKDILEQSEEHVPSKAKKVATRKIISDVLNES